MAPSPALPARVRLVDVGPRDGLQNERGVVPADVKATLIEMLADAGLPGVEATSFVSPKWVPQMADAAEVMSRVHRRAGVIYSVLVPNMKGFEGALAAKADEIVVFAAASEAFSQRNINCSIAESIERFRAVVRGALDAGMRVRGAISVALGCPYQGEVRPAAVGEVARRMLDIGVQHCGVADTIGVGTPIATQRAMEAALRVFPLDEVSGHFHDTYGQALANVYACLEMGVATFDASVAGLGGCPYAKGATGNVATEDVVYLLHGLGIETGVDLSRLRAAGRYISGRLGRPTHSRVARALDAKEGVAGEGRSGMSGERKPVTASGAVPSPCISVCAMDAASGLCTGCLRTLDEIAAWSVMDDDAKRAVLAAASTRRGSLKVTGDGRG